MRGVSRRTRNPVVVAPCLHLGVDFLQSLSHLLGVVPILMIYTDVLLLSRMDILPGLRFDRVDLLPDSPIDRLPDLLIDLFPYPVGRVV